MSGVVYYAVQTCTARQDGAYLLTYRKTNPKATGVAVCALPLEPGDQFRVTPGAGGYEVATPRIPGGRG